MVLSMEKWVNKVAIVTGASTGIGKAIVERLVEEGVKVVGMARRVDLIENTAKDLGGKKGKLYGFKVDLNNEQSILKAIEWTTKNVGPVSVLINNAATFFGRPLLQETTENYKKIMDVNVVGLCVATREAVKIMRQHNIDGHIIHINSICGHYVIPLVNHDLYTASKHAVTALTESMRLELNSMKSKIKVTSLSPGVVDTPIFTEEFRKTELFQKLVGTHLLKCDDIADAVVYILSTPPHVQIHELMIKPVNEAF